MSITSYTQIADNLELSGVRPDWIAQIRIADDLLNQLERVMEQVISQGFVNQYEGARTMEVIAKARGK